MDDHEVDLAMLSSFEISIFFYKKGQTLYMSDSHTSFLDPVLATFIYIALALGIIDRDKLKVPDIDTSHWPQKNTSDSPPGVGPRYIFPSLILPTLQ